MSCFHVDLRLLHPRRKSRVRGWVEEGCPSCSPETCWPWGVQALGKHVAISDPGRLGCSLTLCKGQSTA